MHSSNTPSHDMQATFTWEWHTVTHSTLNCLNLPWPPSQGRPNIFFYRLLFKKRKSTTVFLEFLKGFQRKEHNNQTITNWTVLNATLGWLRTERWGWTCMEFPKHTDTILNWTVWGQAGQACLQHRRISMSEMKAIQKLTSTKVYIYFGFPWYVDHLET